MWGRTPEQQALAEAQARAGAADKDVRMLKAALNSRDATIRSLRKAIMLHADSVLTGPEVQAILDQDVLVEKLELALKRAPQPDGGWEGGMAEGQTGWIVTKGAYQWNFQRMYAEPSRKRPSGTVEKA